MKAEDIIKKVDILDSERAGITSYWQDLANFCFPRKAWITAKKNTGDRLNFSQLFDSVAIRALQIMAAGFSSHLTNPSSKWFSLGTKDIKLMTSKAVQIWFKEVEEEIFSTLSTSNFEPVMQEFYLDSGCFGTGSILSEEDFKTRVRFTSIPLSEIYIEEDFSGRINRVYRQFEYTVQQAYGRWGDDAGEAVREQMRENKPQNLLKKLKFIHSVVPREYRDRSKIDNLNMPWQSQWVEVSKKENIAESGFEEFPYHTGRFNKLTGEVWGFSPAMNVLSDIRMVSAAKKTLIRAAMKMVDPPFIIPQRGFIQPLNFNPGGPNYSKSQTVKDSYQAIETKGNFPIGFELIQDIKRDIEKGFFVPVFQAFVDITKTMTVPEVQRRIAENMTLLGPVVGRFTQEVFDPLITRVFMILNRQGVLPPPPEEIQGQELDIIYISQLAKAQRVSEIQEIQSFLGDVQAISAVLPNVVDKVDGDEAVDIIARARRVNPSILRDTKTVEDIRAARAEQEAQAAQMAMLEQGAGILKSGSEAEKNLSGKK